MLPYWVMFVMPATASLARLRVTSGVWILIGCCLALIIGLRYEVGGDWGAYQHQLITHGNLSPLDIIFGGREPAYRMLNWSAYNLGLDLWFVNLICAGIFSTGLVSFANRLPDPFLAITIAIPYLVIVVSMGYTRQAAAIGLILLSLKYFGTRKSAVMFLLLILAGLFHRTAILFMCVAILPYMQRRLASALLLLPMVIGIYYLILAEQQESLVYGYVNSEYATKSTGGLIRTLLSGCFAAVFLIVRKRLAISDLERSLWTWISIVALVLVLAAVNYPTAADRLGLFFLPVQIFVSCHMLTLVDTQQRKALRTAIILFFTLVMATWLFFADNRSSWLPYNFWPLA